VVALTGALRLTVSSLIWNDQANAQPCEIQDARNVKGAGIHAHAAVKTKKRNAVANIRVRETYAVDCRRHFDENCVNEAFIANRGRSHCRVGHGSPQAEMCSRPAAPARQTLTAMVC